MAPNLIFITGATGFIGSQTVNAALAAGYRIRLSIRRKEQEHDIQRWIVGSEEGVEFAHVPDLTASGAYEGLLDDVDFIFHLASPLPGKGEDVHKDYVDPAVSGTLAILKEAARSESVKFVVVVSSILALIPVGGMSKSPVIPKGMFRTPMLKVSN
jgi:nucleoside-diphosphate-sugar epimerase